MNNDKNVKNKIAGLIEESQNIAVMPSKVAGMDAFGAGVALYHMLKELDKDVSFIYPGKTPEKAENLIKPEDITKDVKSRSLLVSIDYSDTDATKVNYSTDNDVLYLTINPIPDDFDKNTKIKSRITGFDFDIIFVVGAQNVSDLGSTFRNLDSASKTSKIINVDNTEINERFGFVNIVDNSVNSVSQLVMEKVSDWELNINQKAAKALLEGIIAREGPNVG
ncbi:bifunctional oligoribonuclease/PAP phosphatase NrnA [Patescibacteria group bacterium]